MKNQTIILRLAILILGLTNSNLLAQNHLPRLYINEFMAANESTLYSPDYQEYTDWLEIHNAEDTTVDISGFFLTDDLSKPDKWPIPPATKIRPGWKILFWADGRNEGRHTSFSLSKDGEEIGLFTPDGQLIDAVRFPSQITDMSYGRYPDGIDTWYLFDQPTPAAANKNAGYTGITGAPEFSVPGGFYSGGVSVALVKQHPDESIRYTLDGSLPDQKSFTYRIPIQLTSTTVIRAQTIRQGYLPGPVITHTYFIDETTPLPVISIATNPANLWDDQIGIYVIGTNGIAGYCTDQLRNWNQPWERPVSLELYEANRQPGFKIDAGMQIGGGCTRLYPQKPLAIFARGKYGASKINYQVFPDKPIHSFNNLLIRNSGQDWWRAMFRDGFMHTLVKNRMNIDWVAYRPAILFLNGEYWGIHEIREKHNEHYLAANYDIDPNEIDILGGNAEMQQGSAKNYQELIKFIETHDLAVLAHFEWVQTQMDVTEYLDYVIAEIYFANIDWPGGNIEYWRQQGENHKWRWILFDTDLGFGAHPQGQYNSNTLENATAKTATYYANPPWATLLLRKLLENADFKSQFIQRFASHLNITFHPQRVLHIMDSLKTQIEPEMPRHIQKWEKSTSFNGGWNYHLTIMQEFATKRPKVIIDHLTQKFGLSGTAKLTVTSNAPAMGHIFINSVKLPDENFSGTYFKDIPIRCQAVPKPGYRFAGWQGIANSSADSIGISLTKDATLTAIFEIDNADKYAGLYINEILALNSQTHADENNEFDDWIELYNASENAIDISGLYLTDDLNQPEMWQIPASAPDLTTIQPGQFLLLWADKQTAQGILHLNLKLSGAGDAVGLAQKTATGFTWVDTLVFGPQTTDVSYGRSPDGADNFVNFTIPTPGSPNINTTISENDAAPPATTRLKQNYPNPFNAITTFRYQLASESHVKLTIYDISGREIQTIINHRQSAGEHTAVFDASHLTSSIYIYKLSTATFVQCRKMLILK